jgi:hypothetical protein
MRAELRKYEGHQQKFSARVFSTWRSHLRVVGSRRADFQEEDVSGILCVLLELISEELGENSLRNFNCARLKKKNTKSENFRSALYNVDFFLQR